VCAELFYTERAHVRNLKVMQQLFYQPMREDAAIGADFVALLFPNIDDMIELHGESGHRLVVVVLTGHRIIVIQIVLKF